MKYFRVFTILLCLTLSMTILSACGDKEPNANSNPSSASGGSTQSENAQNSDAPEEDTPSIELADMAWSIEGTTYFFYADGTVEITDGSDSVFGEYEWDGVMGAIVLGEDIASLTLDEEGDLYLQGEDDEYYLMTYVGIAGGGDHEGDDDSDSPYEDVGDGNVRYTDYDCNISVVFSDWLSCLEGEIVGVVTISDDDEGYVVSENLTDEYWNYSGSDDEFILNYMDNNVTRFFEELYGGGWSIYTQDNFGGGGSDGLGAAEMNIYNDDYDIYIRTYLYRSSDGESSNNIIAQTFFVDYDDYNDEADQFNTLFNEVGFATTAQ